MKPAQNTKPTLMTQHLCDLYFATQQRLPINPHHLANYTHKHPYQLTILPHNLNNPKEKPVENIIRTGENAGNPAFSPFFPTMFSNLSKREIIV